MDAASLYAERRQFGRREIDVRGIAIVPRQAVQPFTLRNISDGGALLRFDDPSYAAPSSFRIEITGTEFVLWCELRHQGGAGAGVRFIQQAEGTALNRFLQVRPVEGLASMAELAPPLSFPLMNRISNRTLRLAFLTSMARDLGSLGLGSLHVA